MVFGSRMLNKEINIKMLSVNIERVRVTQLLGVFIGELLNSKPLIKCVQLMFSKRIAITHSCSHRLDRNSKCILYSSLFLPYLNYNVEIWENAYPTNTSNIVLLQKSNPYCIWCKTIGSHKLIFSATICTHISRYHNI